MALINIAYIYSSECKNVLEVVQVCTNTLSIHVVTLFDSISFLNLAPTAAPEQLSLASKSSTSLTLSWNPPPFEDTNGAIQYYTVRVTEVDTNTTFPERNSFNTQITFNNLHPYYIYRCTVAAYTIGLGPYTQAITVQLNQEGILSFWVLVCTSLETDFFVSQPPLLLL